MSKEEIREKHLKANGLKVNNSEVGRMIQKASFGAMDEYAKQEAIGFSKWLATNFKPDLDFTDEWILSDGKRKSNTEQLYELYLQNKNK